MSSPISTQGLLDGSQSLAWPFKMVGTEMHASALSLPRESCAELSGRACMLVQTAISVLSGSPCRGLSCQYLDLGKAETFLLGGFLEKSKHWKYSPVLSFLSRKKPGAGRFLLRLYHCAKGRDYDKRGVCNFPTGFNVAAFVFSWGAGLS